MKKWAIWHKEDNKIVHMYDSEEPIQFGGPWGNQICCHHEVDQNLWQYNASQLELREVNVQIGTQRVPKLADGVAETKIAYDEADQPILDDEGNTVILPVFKTVSVYKKETKIVKKIGV